MTGLADTLDALLPQTQCTRCGYPGCRPYAEALAAAEAELDRCPPGGDATVIRLAAVLGRAPRPVDPLRGEIGPPRVAVIDETVCIGCAKCLICPVDAIVGARKFMHTVIAAECSGCDLCLPACPVDCIAMVATASEPLGGAAILERAQQYRARYEAHNRRLAQLALERDRALSERRPGAP
jgi:electron transport complex protein RnfB